MLRGNHTINYYSKGNAIVWMTMALQAGLINSGGMMACHRFVSHVTGFATAFGMEWDRTSFPQAVGILAVPVFFLLGSMLSGFLVDLRLKLRKKPRYFIPFGINFVLILMVYLGGSWGYFGKFGEPNHWQLYFLLSSLCLVCGIQNGAVTSVSRSVIRTTHLTGITTDLGVGIVRFWNRNKVPEYPTNEGKANLMRAGIITFFIAGSVGGAYLYSSLRFEGFLAPTLTAGALLGGMIYFQLTPAESHRTGEASRS